MDSQSQNLGNFLTPEETNKAEYDYNKPVIKMTFIAVLLFVLTGIACEFLSIGYAWYSFRPVQYDSEAFAAGQKIQNELQKRADLIKESRPSGINVIAVMAAVMDAKPKDITLTSIDISESRSTFTGQAQSLDIVNQFCNSIDLTGHKATVESIKTPSESEVNKMQQFVISVEPLAKAAKSKPTGGTDK